MTRQVQEMVSFGHRTHHRSWSVIFYMTQMPVTCKQFHAGTLKDCSQQKQLHRKQGHPGIYLAFQHRQTKSHVANYYLCTHKTCHSIALQCIPRSRGYCTCDFLSRSILCFIRFLTKHGSDTANVRIPFVGINLVLDTILHTSETRQWYHQRTTPLCPSRKMDPHPSLLPSSLPNPPLPFASPP